MIHPSVFLSAAALPGAGEAQRHRRGEAVPPQEAALGALMTADRPGGGGGADEGAAGGSLNLRLKGVYRIMLLIRGTFF